MNPLQLPESMRKIRSKAFSLIRDRSFFRGRITLASGKESDFYFDMKPTMLSPEGATLLAELLLDRLRETEVEYVGGLAVGAVLLISPINMLSFIRERPIHGFFVRKEIKDHGTKRLIDGLAKGESLQGKRVVVVEDVTTTGGSSMLAVKAAQDAGADVIMVLSVVDRQDGTAELYEKAGIPFVALFTAGEFLAVA
jgi:orotate phosphoribosyltransferase